jgi:hypothetical protein
MTQHPKIEVAARFNVDLFFINSQGTMVQMVFNLPPGVYPSKEYTVKLLTDAQKDAIRALRVKTMDLSWRLPTANEFIKFSSGGNQPHAWGSKYQEPYTVEFDNVSTNVLGDNEQEKGVLHGLLEEQKRETLRVDDKLQEGQNLHGQGVHDAVDQRQETQGTGPLGSGKGD